MEHERDLREIDHGKYTEIFDEKEVIRTSANEKKCIIHFYHRNFQRCKIMDKHLEALAPKYFDTRFLRVFVENVPWLVEKLGVKVLPCVIVFIDGVTKDRIVGFEELGNADDFETSALEMRLKVSGVCFDLLSLQQHRSCFC
ncbi:thioredoxin-like protein [Serendipita vermifera]|nr:thioredoxin-like protein [Serendipita vermifera]